jgi:hypothetical protein
MTEHSKSFTFSDGTQVFQWECWYKHEEKVAEIREAKWKWIIPWYEVSVRVLDCIRNCWFQWHTTCAHFPHVLSEWDPDKVRRTIDKSILKDDRKNFYLSEFRNLRIHVVVLDNIRWKFERREALWHSQKWPIEEINHRVRMLEKWEGKLEEDYFTQEIWLLQEFVWERMVYLFEEFEKELAAVKNLELTDNPEI